MPQQFKQYVLSKQEISN